MKTPDEEVADKIIDKFRSENLLSERGIKKLLQGLSAGNLSAEDWKLVFETERPATEKKNV